MLIRLLTASIFLATVALLILQRFSMPPEFPVIDASTGETFSRGEIITTDDDYFALTIGENNIYLAENTVLELDRVYEDELVVTLTKGRLLISAQGDTPFVIETNHTDHLVHKGTASFINYDWLETIHVIPLDGSVQTTIRGTNEFLLTPTPISIHETAPVTYEPLKVSLDAGASAPFYTWTGVLTGNAPTE